MKQEKACIISLPEFYDPRGCLTVAEEQSHVPFRIGNTEWICGTPADALFHRHSKKQCFVVALAGSTTARIVAGETTLSFSLHHPTIGLCIQADTSLQLTHCSEGAVLLILHEL